MAVRCRNATRRRSSSVKMAAPLATCTKEEQRSVIRFVSSEELKPVEIHRRMKLQYGDACLSLQQAYEWTRKFMNGVSSVTDWSGTPSSEDIVKENRRVTVNEIAAQLRLHRKMKSLCAFCVQ